MAALNPKRARILMGGLIAAGVVFTVLVLALDEDGRPGFPAGIRLPVQTAEGASWSPDGRWVAIPNRAGVLLRAADGSTVRQLRAPRTPRYRGSIPGRIGWSRDGERLRYVTTVGPEEGEGAWVTEVPAGGGAASQRALGTKVDSADWAPRGWPLVYAPAAGGGIWSLSSFDGRPEKLLDRPGREGRPQISPDGTRILFTLSRDGKGQELWIARADGTAPRRLTDPYLYVDYSWAPNSRRLAIIGPPARSNGASRLFVVAARNGDLRALPAPLVAFGGPAWTPGGRWITYATTEGRIKKVRPDGSETRELSDFPDERVRDLLWSPNGRKLAYSSAELPEESD